MGGRKREKKARYKSMPLRVEGFCKSVYFRRFFPFSVFPETPETQAMYLPNPGRLHTGGGNMVYKEH